MIKEIQKRVELGEGRNFGMGYSILKKVEDNFETYLPFTACKDYLNDLVYVEHKKKEISKVHGYKHYLLNIFDNQESFYLGICALDYNHNGGWKQYEDYKRILLKNTSNIVDVINKIESIFPIYSKTSLVDIQEFTHSSGDTTDNSAIVLNISTEWIKNPYYISFLTLAIRCLFNYNGKLDPLDTTFKTYIDGDSYFMSIIKDILEIKDKEELFKYDWDQSESSHVHNNGCQYAHKSYVKKNEKNKKKSTGGTEAQLQGV